MPDPLMKESHLWNDPTTGTEMDEPISCHSALLPQYQLCVEMADRISARRATINSYFLTLNTGIFTVFGFLLQNEKLRIPFMIFTLLVCLSWWWTLRSYRLLNQAKFRVIGEMESRLLSAPYKCEWHYLGEGKDWKLYMSLSTLESLIPAGFAVLYLVMVFLWP